MIFKFQILFKIEKMFKISCKILAHDEFHGNKTAQKSWECAMKGWEIKFY